MIENDKKAHSTEKITKEEKKALPFPCHSLLLEYKCFLFFFLVMILLFSIQSYKIHRLSEKMSLADVEIASLRSDKSDNDGKISDINKKILQLKEQVQSLHPQPSALQEMTTEKFQAYSLGTEQIDSIKQILSDTFALKSDLQSALQNKSEAVISIDLLKRAILSGKPYAHILDAAQKTLLAHYPDNKNLLTAFGILRLSSSSGLPSLTTLYDFPKTQEEKITLPSWLSWITDYMSMRAHVSQELSIEHHERLIRLLEGEQILEASHLVNRHVEEHPLQKERWGGWLKAADMRAKTMQSIDSIYEFLLKSIQS